MRSAEPVCVNKVVAKQANCVVVNGSSHIVIACDTRQLPENATNDVSRNLLRKATDAIFDFIGFR